MGHMLRLATRSTRKSKGRLSQMMKQGGLWRRYFHLPIRANGGAKITKTLIEEKVTHSLLDKLPEIRNIPHIFATAPESKRYTWTNSTGQDDTEKRSLHRKHACITNSLLFLSRTKEESPQTESEWFRVRIPTKRS